MIVRHLPDGWILFLDDDDGEREMMRVKLPKGGLSISEWERVRDFLLKEASGKRN